VVTIASIAARLKRSFVESAGTIVFGMEDGTVSIFGLVFGVAATTSNSAAVLVAGASGAAAAAVSMMAGAYLDAETSRDEAVASAENHGADLTGDNSMALALVSKRLAAVGLTPQLSKALVDAVQRDHDAVTGLLAALRGTHSPQLDPREQALWMLFADFLSAAVPIVPFMLLPVAEARVISAIITIALLAALGVGRARIGKRNVVRTVAETVSMGIAAAFAGVAIGVLINRGFGA